MKWIPFLFALACSGAKTDDSETDEPSTDTSEEVTQDSAADTSEEPTAAPSESNVVINEILAKSDLTEDWLELYNGGDSSVDLSGCALFDDGTAEDPWIFPEGTEIDAGDFLLVWADDGVEGEGLHATFKLSKDGETLTFLDASGVTLDSVEFPALAAEESYARTEDGGSEWGIVSSATPAASNH